MKINDPLNGVPAIRNRDIRKAKATPSATPSHQGNDSDSVELTPISSRLSLLGEEMGRIDSADTGKVEAIRQAIAEGSFQVDEEAVADALIQGAMEQLRHQGNGK